VAADYWRAAFKAVGAGATTFNSSDPFRNLGVHTGSAELQATVSESQVTCRKCGAPAKVKSGDRNATETNCAYCNHVETIVLSKEVRRLAQGGLIIPGAGGFWVQFRRSDGEIRVSRRSKGGGDLRQLLRSAGASLAAAALLHVVLGIVLPSLDLIVAPLFCKGSARLVTEFYSYKPGNMTWARSIECIDPTIDITFLTWPTTTLLMAIPIFAMVMLNSRGAETS